MNHSEIFAQQFSRLVWLASQEPARPEADLESAARAAESMLRGAGATISVRDWRLAVNDALVPDALSGVPDLTLAARLIGHGVVMLKFDEFAPRSELRAVAGLLAGEPEVGDRGKKIASRVQPLGLQKIHVTASGTLSPDIPAPAIDEIEAVRRRFATPPPEPMSSGSSSTENLGNIPLPFDHSVAAPPGPPPSTAQSGVFAVLDAASKTGTLARILEDLMRQAETAANRNDTTMVYDIMHAIVVREQTSRSGESRTPYVVAMKRLARPVLIRPLVRHLSTHKELDEQIGGIFVRLGEEAAELLVLELAESQQRNERRTIFDVLVKLKSGHKALRHSLTDPRWYVARNAAEVLGQIQADGAADDLTELLKHADDRVRRAAVSSLGILTAQQGTTEPLMRALNDPSSTVRTAAAAGLGARRNAKSLDALLARFDKEDNSDVLNALLDSLGKNGTPSAVKKLVEAAEPAGLLSKRKSTAYRSAAAAALRNVDSPVAKAAIEKLRQDKDAEVRSAAGG